MKRTIAFLAALAVLLLVLGACNKDGDTSAETTVTEKISEPMDISSLDLSLYIKLGEYKGIEISLNSDTSRGDAVWKKVLEGTEVIQYPEEQVKYYFEGTVAQYEYLAKKGNNTYENIISELGVTEEMMMEEARELTKEDLVLHALIKAENITLTDEDKQNNFERYAKKFVEDYGYGEEYVRENMSEQIYDTMLFDKTIEKLITMNTFVETQGD